MRRMPGGLQRHFAPLESNRCLKSRRLWRQWLTTTTWERRPQRNGGETLPLQTSSKAGSGSIESRYPEFPQGQVVPVES